MQSTNCSDPGPVLTGTFYEQLGLTNCSDPGPVLTGRFCEQLGITNCADPGPVLTGSFCVQLGITNCADQQMQGKLCTTSKQHRRNACYAQLANCADLGRPKVLCSPKIIQKPSRKWIMQTANCADLVRP